ncbi:MAG: glycosyltransferase family 4 protein [Vicinamibacteraceae bacterium]
MKGRPSILFLCHSASRNGASLLLLQFLQWLKGRVDWDITILVDGRGPLLEDFRSVGRTHVLRNTDSVFGVLPAGWKTALEPRFKAWYARTLLGGRRFDLIHANTVAVWPQARALKDRAGGLLWHVHELGYALSVEIPRERARQLFRDATAFVAVSHAVRDTLAGEYDVRPELVNLVHGFVPVPDLTPDQRAGRHRRVHEAFGWPDEAFVVGGCGSMGWRKGTDLFLQIAKRVVAAGADDRVRFLWVGGSARGKDALEFEHDRRALGLEGRCARVPAATDVLDYYCAMDVFALTSREDPFPLVMLEAGANRLPVVCFADSGGGPEFVESDAGLVVPCQDVAAFANCLLKLRDDPSLREALGAAALSKVRANYSVEAQAPKLSKTIERYLTG